MQGKRIKERKVDEGLCLLYFTMTNKGGCSLLDEFRPSAVGYQVYILIGILHNNSRKIITLSWGIPVCCESIFKDTCEAHGIVVPRGIHRPMPYHNLPLFRILNSACYETPKTIPVISYTRFICTAAMHEHHEVRGYAQRLPQDWYGKRFAVESQDVAWINAPISQGVRRSQQREEGICARWLAP